MRLFMMILLIQVFLALNVQAEVFYKDNSLSSAATSTTPLDQPVNEKKDEINCQKNLNGCRTSSQPTKLSAFGDCKVLTSISGKPLFVPARTKKEWARFLSWAEAHPEIVSMDSCTNPSWTDWTDCSSTCGKGTRTRQCIKSGDANSCKGPASITCQNYSKCSCGPLQPTTAFCEGSDQNFTAELPKVTYVNFDKCDGITKCQAHCPQDVPALPDGSACAP